MTYDYIKRTYSFQPEVGRRVRHAVTQEDGVIKREDKGMGHYVMVLFDGRKHALPCHPGELAYISETVE
jgi:hypothetical protein